MTEIGDLDRTILAVIWKFGPCTAYGVRRNFSISPTARFSDSTGSIYPAIKRLESSGLIIAKADLRGQQSRKLLKVSKKGERVVRDWVLGSLQEFDLAVPSDPIRTRIYFLGLLDPKERLQFLDNAISDLEKQSDEIRKYQENYTTEGPLRWSSLAAKASHDMHKARLRSFRMIRKELESERPDE